MYNNNLMDTILKSLLKKIVNLLASLVMKEMLALSPVSTVSARRTTWYSVNGQRFVMLLAISVVDVFNIKSPVLPINNIV